MAASFMKKTMAYLGLVDDDYDDYDDYESRSPTPVGRVGQRPASTVDGGDEPAVPAPSPRIRTLTREETGAAAAAAPAGLGARPSMGSSSVRPITQESASARVHIVAPGRFADAQEIANRLMNNQPVIVNMQNADRDLQRRMIDFCSGATYALSGGMERVADEVFLLTPSNVKVSDEERQRLADRGLVNP
ncbi:MAG TPA: cell division protein SepF [Acidimicrobiales bacterium]|nr:cell division protein SepF [Acidimicrobiales bacterium]